MGGCLDKQTPAHLYTGTQLVSKEELTCNSLSKFQGMVLKEACGYTYMTLSKDIIMLVNRPVVAEAALKEDTNDQHIRQF